MQLNFKKKTLSPLYVAQFTNCLNIFLFYIFPKPQWLSYFQSLSGCPLPYKISLSDTQISLLTNICIHRYRYVLVALEAGVAGWIPCAHQLKETTPFTATTQCMSPNLQIVQILFCSIYFQSLSGCPISKASVVDLFLKPQLLTYFCSLSC